MENREATEVLRDLLDTTREYPHLDGMTMFGDAIDLAIAALEKQEQDRWIPVTERFPSKEERRVWIDKNLGGVGYLYPCLVTRYSSINPDRAKNNPYVAKHYYDGEDFVNNGEEVCSEYIVAWKPLPEPYQEDEA